MKSSEQLEQQSLEREQFPKNREDLTTPEQLAIEQQRLDEDKDFAKEQARQDTKLGVVDAQKSVVLDTADQEFVGAEQKLKHEVLKYNKERHMPGKETHRHVTAKPVGSRYGAGMTEQQIAARVQVGKKQAELVVTDQLIPQASRLPLVGGIVEWLEKRAA